MTDDGPTHRERNHERNGDEVPRTGDILDVKQLIDMIPKANDDLFSYEINWAVYDEVSFFLVISVIQFN